MQDAKKQKRIQIFSIVVGVLFAVWPFIFLPYLIALIVELFELGVVEIIKCFRAL